MDLNESFLEEPIKTELSKNNFRIKHYRFHSLVYTLDNEFVCKVYASDISPDFSSVTWEKASKDINAGAYQIRTETSVLRKKLKI
jgi:hypothetical protein